MAEPLLELHNLRTRFRTDRGIVTAVDGVSFGIEAGKTLAVVGESGCGKSVTALSILRLIPNPPGEIAGGEIRFQGRDLARLPEAEMRAIRGNRISMIFQEPMTSLNPVYTVGEQIAEAVRLHLKQDRKSARATAAKMLEHVGIPAPEQRADAYPHELSGGMRQRVMIAMALSCRPLLLIADEPTTALDVTIQAQIMDLMARLQRETGMAVMLITHDLGVVAEAASEVVVMYAGVVVEQAPVRALFAAPAHPYTRGLLDSLPSYQAAGEHGMRLRAIPGIVPNLLELPCGCRFQDRCTLAADDCRAAEPPLADIGGRLVRCFHPLTGANAGSSAAAGDSHG